MDQDGKTQLTGKSRDRRLDLKITFREPTEKPEVLSDRKKRKFTQKKQKQQAGYQGHENDQQR
ncbi:MAG: hypothetical protein WBM35_05930, partial [Candidatus Electrothrix sp.]